MNCTIYPDSWRERRSDDEIIAKFCGDVAIAQYMDELDWLLEQPVASDLKKVQPWPQILADSRTEQVVFDQCQCGARTAEGQNIKID